MKLKIGKQFEEPTKNLYPESNEEIVDSQNDDYLVENADGNPLLKSRILFFKFRDHRKLQRKRPTTLRIAKRFDAQQYDNQGVRSKRAS